MQEKKELKSIKLLMNFLNLKESHKGEFCVEERVLHWQKGVCISKRANVNQL